MAGELTTNTANETQPEINIQLVQGGFGSYLDGILPPDIAVAAGAFGASISQIRNITNVPVEKLAQAAMTIETTKGLNINGSDIPTILSEADQALNLIALGSGPRGQYTTSDFFGCMSGLPYPLRDIYNQIGLLQTTKLHNIYHELFLAVTWEKAYCTIVTRPYYVNVQQYIEPTVVPPDPGQPRIDDLYYTVSITIADTGGGYGRGTATAPFVTLTPNNCGATVNTTIGTDDNGAASMSGGTFGRVVFSIANGGAYKYATITNSSNNSAPSLTANPPPVEYITVQAPPTNNLPITQNGAISTAGVNTPGDTYRSVGAVIPGTPGWPSMNTVVQGYINQANEEILAIRNNRPRESFLLNKLWDRTGEQLTREQRARSIGLSPLPVPKDDNLNRFPTSQIVFTDAIPQFALNTKPHMTAQTLEAIANLCTSGGQSLVGMMRESRNQNKLTAIGIPLDNNIPDTITSKENKQLIANGLLPGTIPAKLEQVRCADGAILAPSPVGYYDPSTNSYIVTNPGIQPVIDADGSSILTPLDVDTVDPNFPVFPPIIPGDPGPGTPIDTGEPDFPGSFGGGDFGTIIPPELNPPYFSNNVLSSVYSINEAIDDVIRCNCDCWDDL
jgi:hypothetical protein